jgi:hypothetical protein
MTCLTGDLTELRLTLRCQLKYALQNAIEKMVTTAYHVRTKLYGIAGGRLRCLSRAVPKVRHSRSGS